MAASSSSVAEKHSRYGNKSKQLLKEWDSSSSKTDKRKSRNKPQFSTPETLKSFTRDALSDELVDAGILCESELTSARGRLCLSALNKVYEQLTGEPREFTVRRDFFRAVKDNESEIGILFGDNDIGRSDSFTREGLAKVVDELCEVEEYW